MMSCYREVTNTVCALMTSNPETTSTQKSQPSYDMRFNSGGSMTVITGIVLAGIGREVCQVKIIDVSFGVFEINTGWTTIEQLKLMGVRHPQ